MAALAVKLNWTNVQLHGFWFVTNFLRGEGFDDFAVKTIMDDLTEQYDKYRLSKVETRHFGPDFKFDTEHKPYIGKIEMFDSITKQCFGETIVCFDDNGGVSILPF